MSIRFKLTVMFLAIAVIPLLCVSFLTFHNYKKSIESTQLLNLQNIVSYKADKISTYFAGVRSDMELAQGLYNIKKNLPVLSKFTDDTNNPEAVAARNMLNEQLREMQSVLSYVSDIMLLNSSGRVVYANRPGHYSKDFFKGPFDVEHTAFAEGRKKIYFSDIYFDKVEDNRYEMLATAPATDLNDVQTGVIALEIDMTPVYRIIQDNTGMGFTGESVVGKKLGDEVLYLSPLKYDPNAALKRSVTIGSKVAIPVQNAVLGKTGSGITVDYRGKNIIGAWTYLPSLDWGLAAKIDADEAFADVTNLRNIAAAILLIVIVLSSFTAFSIAQSISEPIKLLSDGAEIIGRGNLDYKVGTTHTDEIGQLSRAFDKMTGDLKQTLTSRDELEIRVKERTAELDKAVLNLQQQVRQRGLAEEASRSALLYARGLLEASLDPLVTISADGKITDVNEAAIQVTGVNRQQLIGTDFSDYFTDPQKAREGYKKVFDVGFVTDYPLTIRRKDGHLTDVLYNSVVYKNEKGKIQGIFAAARDVTEQKRAERRQKVTNSLLELYAKKSTRKEYLDSAVKVISEWSGCSRVGIRVKDEKGNIPYESCVGFEEGFLKSENKLNVEGDNCLCIRAIKQDFIPRDRTIRTSAGSFYSNDSLAFVNQLTTQDAGDYRGNCMKQGFQSIAVIPIRYRDDILGAIHLADSKKDMVSLAKVQFIESTISPLVGEAINRFNAESELEKYRLHLEDLVKHRTEALARSNKDLEQFAYVASHDLQEPLRAVAGFIGLLKMRLEKSLDEKNLEYMTFSVDGVSRMQTLINGLLEYSRIDTRGKHPEPTDSKTALDNALLHLRAAIDESGAVITSENLPIVKIDPVQLVQLFQNLIGNAIKFRSDSKPAIHVSAGRQDNAWRFAVRDNGIGIDPQYAHKIFLIFQRLHTRKQYPGTGIGLSICKKIVERHGGKIWLESQPGLGSTFYFTIPDSQGV